MTKNLIENLLLKVKEKSMASMRINFEINDFEITKKDNKSDSYGGEICGSPPVSGKLSSLVKKNYVQIQRGGGKGFYNEMAF